MVNSSYKDVFRKRAQSHDDAFRIYPEACKEEVENCLKFAKLKPGDVLLDIPSAGGFLSSYLTIPNIHIIAIDPCPELFELCSKRVVDSYLAPLDCLPLANESVDVAICLAGLHHEANPHAVLSEIRRVIKKKGGRLIVAEIDADSNVARFFNEFVHFNNSEGHHARFVDSDFVSNFAKSGLTIVNDEVLEYYWPFASHFDLGDCLQRMFGINLSTPEKIADAVDEILGIDPLPNGRVGMRWSLRMFYTICDIQE
jgi:ubiquinone/menaquinone biosynthesis C-methylase UbiE